MINRFLSMKSDWVELVNEFQKYSVKPKDLYKFYINVLPKKKQWLKYVKGRKQMEFPKWAVEIVRRHYEISYSEALDYIDTYMMSEGGKLELQEILVKYGSDPKEIKKLNII